MVLSAGEVFTSPNGTTHRVYWVEFDEPQRDADGDGPYAKAQVNEIYMEPVS